MNSQRYRFAAGLSLLPCSVHAHPFHWSSESVDLISGLLHPLTSLEHVSIMLMVGYGFSRFGKPASLALSCLFISWMMAGVGLSLTQFAIPNVDVLVSLPVLILLGMIVFPHKKTAFWTVLMSAILATMHGYQHAYDIWLDANALDYTCGFAGATLFLLVAGNVAGVVMGWLTKNIRSARSPKGYHWTGVLNNPMYPAKHKE